MTFIITTIIIIPVIIASLTQATQNNLESALNNWTHFECGFQSISNNNSQFSLQFFFISILFLIFDIEIALILMLPLESLTTNNLTVIVTILLMLTLALLYEWQNSKIFWSK